MTNSWFSEDPHVDKKTKTKSVENNDYTLILCRSVAPRTAQGLPDGAEFRAGCW